MLDWTSVVTQPLGLAGFALFLIFGLLARLKRRDERRWLAPLAAGMAVLALAGGMILAYLKTPAPIPTSPPQTKAAPASSQQQTNQVQQTSSGPGSPNVQGVQGNVTITVDQSSGKAAGKGTEPTKAAPQPPEKKSQ